MELHRGQAKGHPACTCRSGPLPASLASATRPLLRGKADWLAVWLAAHSLGRGGQAGPRLGTPSLVARRRRVRWFMCACSPHATDDDRSTQQQRNSQQPGRRKRGGPPKKVRRGQCSKEIAGSCTETNACTACESEESPDQSTAIRVLRTSSKYHRGGREESAARCMSLLQLPTASSEGAAQATQRRLCGSILRKPNGCHGVAWSTGCDPGCGITPIHHASNPAGLEG